MKNKTKILFVGIALLLALMAVIFAVLVIFMGRNNPTNTDTTSGTTTGFGSAPTKPTSTIGGKKPTTDDTTSTTPINIGLNPDEVKKLPVLRELTKVPIAGAVFIETPTTSIIRYMQRADGHVYDTYKDQELWIRESQLTIPKVYEAWWFGTKANTALIRLIDQSSGLSQNYLATLSLKPAASTTTLDRPSTSGEAPYTMVGKFIDSNIRSLAVSEDKNELAFISQTEKGSTLYTMATSGKVSLRAPIGGSEWQLQWAGANNFYITSNASALFEGTMFSLGSKESFPRKVIGETRGLTTLVSPGGKYMLYSESSNDDFSLKLYSFASSTTIAVPVKTLPEKCVWISEKPVSMYCAVPNFTYKGAYPDLWYKGEVDFYDTFFKVDIDNYYKTELLKYGKDMSKAIDVIDMKLSKDGSYMIFTNKLDGHLWGLSIKDLLQN